MSENKDSSRNKTPKKKKSEKLSLRCLYMIKCVWNYTQDWEKSDQILILLIYLSKCQYQMNRKLFAS